MCLFLCYTSHFQLPVKCEFHSTAPYPVACCLGDHGIDKLGIHKHYAVENPNLKTALQRKILATYYRWSIQNYKCITACIAKIDSEGLWWHRESTVFVSEEGKKVYKKHLLGMKYVL